MLQPEPPNKEWHYWYCFYFHSPRGEAGLTQYRRPLTRLLWEQWSPNWRFDDATFDVIQMILSSGRTGLMYKQFVEEKQISLNAIAAATFPDGRYPNLFIFLLIPSRGHTVEDNQSALDDLLAQFSAKKPDAETLSRVKTKVRAGLIRRLGSNAGLASVLTTYYAAYGGWRKLFTSLDDLNKVTADDVQRVASRYFNPKNRTVANTRQMPATPAPGARR